MNEIREIVTRAVVAKGKKVLNISEKVNTQEKPYSILGCWVINHEFEATKINNTVKLDGEFEINIWYSTNNNTRTDILREVITYKKDIETKTIVKEYLENSDDILARIIQHPTVTNAKILEDVVEVDITFEIVAEIIGETKMKVTVFKEAENWEEEIDELDMELNEDFLDI
jgi:spore coat protein E